MLWIIPLIWVLTFDSLTAPVESGSFVEDNFPASIVKGAKMNVPQLIASYHYPAETHFATPKDGYILQMFRLPRPGARPVFLMHGLLDSAAGWLLLGPQNGFAFHLYDLGYDVWLGNARGNRYSRNHTSLNPDTDSRFWFFSWHEIGLYDLTAMIDYVLAATSRRKLHYIGHSQGCTTFMVMTSLLPEYNEKIVTMHALAPAVFCNNARSPFRKLALSTAEMAQNAVIELLPHNSLLYSLCLSSRHSLDMCTEAYYQIFGKDPGSIDDKMWPMIYGHETNGCSSRQVLHYLQLIRSKRFNHYDYGPAENQKRYGRGTPPDYPLENVTARVGVYYAYNDLLSNELDVKRMIRLLPNVVDDQLLPQRSWNHMTFIWGKKARQVVQRRVLDTMRKYQEDV